MKNVGCLKLSSTFPLNIDPTVLSYREEKVSEAYAAWKLKLGDEKVGIVVY